MQQCLVPVEHLCGKLVAEYALSQLKNKLNTLMLVLYACFYKQRSSILQAQFSWNSRLFLSSEYHEKNKVVNNLDANGL